MFKLGVYTLFAAGAAIVGMVIAEPAGDPASKRAAATKLLGEGNFKEAYAIFRELALSEGDGKTPAEDLKNAIQSLNQLGLHEELTELVEKTVVAHSKNPYVLHAAGNAYRAAPHWGTLVANEFHRGNRRDSGQYMMATDRDCVRSMQLFLEAIKEKDRLESDAERAELYLDLAAAIERDRTGNNAWRLQEKTNLAELPEYQLGYNRWGWRGNAAVGAPVHENGEPVFYGTPESFDAAKNDGERWRWALGQAKKADPSRGPSTEMRFANFLRSQFGVTTLQSWSGWYRLVLPSDDGKPTDPGPYALHTLSDDETIAKLATGVKRFELPEEFNFVRIYQQVARGEGTEAAQALESLAGEYEDRRQYPRAVERWREAIERFGPGDHNHRQARLDQIIDNWVRFETVELQPAGKPASVVLRYRNGKKVNFEAKEVRFERLLADVQAYLRSNPNQIDWQKINVEDLGHRLVTENQVRYVGETAATWSEEVEPAADHMDRQASLATPLKKAGVYLVSATIEGGNTTRVIVWITDTAIARKQLSNANLYYVADAMTGEPVSNATVEFFGWQHRQLERGRVATLTNRFTARTDETGFVTPGEQEMPASYQWMAVAKTRDGRFAHLGFNGIWYGERQESIYQQNKAYLITDRPVYRPGQSVQFKFWVRRADYALDDRASTFGGESFTVRVTDPRGQTVLEKAYQADEYGGLADSYQLAEGATLGQYSVYIINRNDVSGGGQFRVEEYKKPEFEVTVDAPSEPVMLGESINAKITAKYYFGSPVTNATVHYKVTRTKHEANWYPVGRWDWFYGRGYWWFASDYSWYPGFARWGCFPPMPPWNPWSPEPPEIVAEQEVPIGEDGTVEVTIDTQVAKEIFGDSDHRYEITAEVTDASRRTITGTGSVFAPRDAFQVFAWVDRGFYRAGDVVEASFKAQTIAGKPISGDAKIVLYRVSYDENGKPTEEEVETWNEEVGEAGEVSQKFTTPEAGQYRIACVVTDDTGHAIEGGYLLSVLPKETDQQIEPEGSRYRYNELELTSEKREYRPGETARLLLAADQSDATVLVFVRAENGIYPRPQVVKLKGKADVIEVPLQQRDMPNLFVEAMTITNGEVHTVVRELFLPPEERVINVEVEPSKEEYKPGESANVTLKLTDEGGQPVTGEVALTMYDRSVEYIAGGSNVPDIREYFWKWRRNHHPQTFENLSRYFSNLQKPNEVVMQNLGAFGNIADVSSQSGQDWDDRRSFRMLGSALGPMGGIGGAMEFAEEAMPMPASAAMDAAAAPALGLRSDEFEKSGISDPQAAPALAEATVRSNFADTAFWEAGRVADENGLVKVSLTMPENLTAWKIRTWAMGAGTKVGEGETSVVTRKNLLVRMQAPRFFTETDEVVLSANVHNYLDSEKQAQVSLEVEGETLAFLDEPTRSVKVPAGGEVRVDWRVKAANPGEAIVTMKALTDEESDAMRQTFPVNIHGMLRTESYTGTVRPDESEEVVTFTIPEKRRVNDSLIEVRFSPSLAAAMVDALPYLADYPYGCTEQTLNRFLPTVITQNVLKQMGVKLSEIRDKKTNLNAQEIGDAKERAAGWGRRPAWTEPKNPVWDEAEVAKMAETGLQRLVEMQSGGGGWGWFPGGSSSNPHITALVVHGLMIGKENGLKLPDGVLERGVEWLANFRQQEIAKLKNAESETKPYKTSADNLDAFVSLVLAEAGKPDGEMESFLYRDRQNLTLYALAMYGLSLEKSGSKDRLEMVLRNLSQFVVVDDENDTAYLRLPNEGYWWFWYGSEIEANAYYLKLLAKTNPKGDVAPKLVKYLLNNRKNATYWNSTRDSAIAIEAMADYLDASGETKPDLTVEVHYDGEKQHEVHVTGENLFSFDNAVTIVGDAVEAGEHTVTLRKKGEGPLYWNAYVNVFTQEDFIQAAGLEVKVDRKIYKLTRKEDATAIRRGSRGQTVEGAVEAYDRTELANGDTLESGELIEIELVVESKNDYEYLAFEDMKAAGFEPVEVRSGYSGNSLGAYMELRDEKAAFFVERLPRGQHSIQYRMRAEIPGAFSALPAKGYAMYAPELRGNSDEIKLKIVDPQE